MAEQTYRAAGVDRDAAEEIKRRIAHITARTHGPHVLGGVGGFGALYELSGYREPVLVSSTDGVGTKLKVAAALGQYDTLGEDLVNACVNDIIVCGARPIFFLDYIAMGQLEPDIAEALVTGMAAACESAGCALIGGETAEMPGLYADGDFDLAGFVVGVAEKSEMLDGSAIRVGDILVGVPSNGLHTNGFSLVRRIFNLDEDSSPLSEHYAELGRTLGEALLVPHSGVLPYGCPGVRPCKGDGPHHRRGPDRQYATGAARRPRRAIGRVHVARPAYIYRASGVERRRPRRDVPCVQHGSGPRDGLRAVASRGGPVVGGGGEGCGNGDRARKRPSSNHMIC